MPIFIMLLSIILSGCNTTSNHHVAPKPAPAKMRITTHNINNIIIKYIEPKDNKIYIVIKNMPFDDISAIYRKAIEQSVMQYGYSITQNRSDATIIINIAIELFAPIDVKTASDINNYIINQKLRMTLDGRTDINLNNTYGSYASNRAPLLMLGGAGVGLLAGWLASPASLAAATAGTLIGAGAGYGANIIMNKKHFNQNQMNNYVIVATLNIAQRQKTFANTFYKTFYQISATTTKSIELTTSEQWIEYQTGLIAIGQDRNNRTHKEVATTLILQTVANIATIFQL